MFLSLGHFQRLLRFKFDLNVTSFYSPQYYMVLSPTNTLKEDILRTKQAINLIKTSVQTI